MAADTTKVLIGASGVISIEATTPVVPTDATTALSGFTDLGTIGNAGITESRSRSTNAIKNMAGTTVRVVVTDSGVAFKFVLLETNKAVIEAFYGATVSQTANHGTLDCDPASSGGRKKWVLDVADGSNATRTYVAEGEITEVGDVVYAQAGGEAVGYEVTLTAYPSSTLSGKCFRKWWTILHT